MATKMKSFRLDEWTANEIEKTAEDMGLSQSAVIMLAIRAFTAYGIDTTLNNTNYLDNSASAYMSLIGMSQRDDSIKYDIRGSIESCAMF